MKDNFDSIIRFGPNGLQDVTNEVRENLPKIIVVKGSGQSQPSDKKTK